MPRPARETAEQLKEAHTPRAIKRRFAQRQRHSYLSDFIYGGIDGAVTTFAVVSGVAGAGLDSTIVIILGAANLVGDGFSMAAANFLGVRADTQQIQRIRENEARQIDLYPEGEREELKQIFQGMGIQGDTLEDAVRTVSSNREKWIDVMLTEEHGLARELRSPIRAGSVTFTAFLLIGALPLVPFAFELTGVTLDSPYITSSALTAAAFFAVGAMKCRFVAQRWWRGGLETLAVGGAAATLAYLVGWLIGSLA